MNWMRDPTAETSAVKRARLAPPASLAGKTIGLFDIGKARTDEFFNQVEIRLQERGYKTKRVGKPTNAKVATAENLQKIAAEVDVVMIGLSD
ncbi:MAG: hypothetical protein EBT83_06150 [Betaproteobacteria bacterium]|jgi:hypothetical protein|nr:hypothetical protein [Betaproteobacteria bacterium]